MTTCNGRGIGSGDANGHGYETFIDIRTWQDTTYGYGNGSAPVTTTHRAFHYTSGAAETETGAAPGRGYGNGKGTG